MFCLILILLLFSRRWWGYGYSPYGYYGWHHRYGYRGYGYGCGGYGGGYGGYPYPYGAYSYYDPYWQYRYANRYGRW